MRPLTQRGLGTDRRRIRPERQWGLVPFMVAIVGLRVVEGAAGFMTRRLVRVLAYHGVPDAEAMSAQLEQLATRYHPVDRDEILTAMLDNRQLPPRSVWVTFDDGHADVVTNAQPVLDRLGVRATMFVCPGLVGTTAPFWWDVVDAARDASMSARIAGELVGPEELLGRLKRVDDALRRDVVASLEGRLHRLVGARVTRRQLTEAEIDGWIEAGHHVDNHTWDHPCLTRCSPAEQSRQVAEAHRWLKDRWPDTGRVFAYPNGEATSDTVQELKRLGYLAALTFDHRLAAVHGDHFRVSRLRVSSDSSLRRFSSIVSGAHPVVFHARGVGRR